MTDTQTKEVPAKEQETKQTKEVKLFGYNGINIVEVKTKKEALDEKTLAKLKAQGITEKE